MPLLTAYVMNQCQPRQLKRLYDRREEMLEKLRADYMSAKKPSDKIPAAVAESASEHLATYSGSHLSAVHLKHDLTVIEF